MFLIRLIHLKKIPKLEELLRNIETSQDKTSSKEIETLSNIKNEIKEDIIKGTNSPQIRLRILSKKKKKF